jgi:hypothetical protein
MLTQTLADVAWDGDPEDRLRAAYVSANWFLELGYGAARGRIFREDVDEAAAPLPRRAVLRMLTMQLAWPMMIGLIAGVAGAFPAAGMVAASPSSWARSIHPCTWPPSRAWQPLSGSRRSIRRCARCGRTC